MDWREAAIIGIIVAALVGVFEFYLCRSCRREGWRRGIEFMRRFWLQDRAHGDEMSAAQNALIAELKAQVERLTAPLNWAECLAFGELNSQSLSSLLAARAKGEHDGPPESV